MGYSYSAKAGDTLDTMRELAHRMTGTDNMVLVEGARYFFEVDTRHEDNEGSIKGMVYRLYEGDMIEAYRRFRIDGSGKLAAAPHWLKRMVNRAKDAA